MSILIKAGSGLVAGIVAGSLGLIFFPRPEPDAVKPRAAVEKPQFVVASPSPIATRAQPTTATTIVAEAPKPAPPAAPKPAPTPQVAQAKVAPPSPVAAAPLNTPKAAPTPSVSTAQIASPSPTPASSRAASVAPLTNPSAETRKLADAAAPWSVRGLVALAKGDLSSARVYLTRAADAGDPRAFVALADTYDPAILSKLGVVGAPGDSQRAKDYLAKAAAAGVVAAKERMAALDQTAH